MKLWIAAIALLPAGQALAYEIPPVEPIYAASLDKAGLTVVMASHGCTRKSDLTVAVAKNPPHPLVLIARKHPDTCQSGGTGRVEVMWSFGELGLDPRQPLSIANPLVGDPGPP